MGKRSKAKRAKIQKKKMQKAAVKAVIGKLTGADRATGWWADYRSSGLINQKP